MSKAHPMNSIVLAAAALAAAILPQYASAQGAPRPAIEDFFANPAMDAPRLSPSGRYIAVNITPRGQRKQLAVIDPATGKAVVVAQFTDVDVGRVEWLNDDRLVYETGDSTVGTGDVTMMPGVFAVDRDGGNPRQLVNVHGSRMATGTRIGERMLTWNHRLLRQTQGGESGDVYLARYDYDTARTLRSVSLVRVNTASGTSRPFEGPGRTDDWLLDYDGEPRLAGRIDEGKMSWSIREGEKWRQIAKFDAFGKSPDAFTPLAFGPDGTLYVLTRQHSDTRAVHVFDLASNRIRPEPLINVKGYDFDGHLLFGSGKLLGIRMRTDADGVEWVDARMKAVQADVDRQLPATVNVIELPRLAQTGNALVTAYSDVIPASYYLYDMASKAMSKLGDTHPAIQPAQMGRQQWVQYKARDGLTIPGLLTLPRGRPAKNLPLVVLVHGGPYVRGTSWGWGAQDQFLASRGYAVLQPEFRGSEGFGYAHLAAGFRQWGLKMQDDLTDGVNWLTAQGTVDPQRVCIAGASYGGYATLMGLVREPQLFKCGVNWVGVTDIKLMYTGSWTRSNDASDTWKQYGMPTMIGDPVKDAAQLDATSPVLLADRIRQPLLLAYGGADRRVPLDHGIRFRDAVARNNHDVEWVEYPEEGHGWSVQQNRYDFWARVEKFLDRNIGAGSRAGGVQKAE